MLRFNFLLALLAAAPLFASSAEEEASQIVDQFYDLQFEQAVASAKALTLAHPNSPAGPFYESVAYYQQYLLEDPPSRETFQVFLSFNEKARQNALRLMPAQPALGHYYQGAALGFQARAFVAQKKYAAAIPKARQGAAHLKAALVLDPSLEDANLGLGMYYYFLDKVPAAAKPFTYLMVGMWGDREKGLALLVRTAEKGQTARSEAKSILAAIYSSGSENRWDEAESLLEDLMDVYPDNPRYRLKLAYVMQRRGLWEDANDVLDAEGSWTDDLSPIIRSRTQAMVTYRAVENLLFLGKLDEAERHLAILQKVKLPPLLVDWVRLRTGNLEDARGRPGVAQKMMYSVIRDKKAALLASQFEKTPFPAGPRDVMPNHWPLPTVPE